MKTFVFALRCRRDCSSEGQSRFFDVRTQLVAHAAGRDARERQKIGVADLPADEGVGQVARGAHVVHPYAVLPLR